jgi:cytochrome c5
MGFQGDKGFMPPKGGRPDLSDAEIMAAVDYITSQAKAQ